MLKKLIALFVACLILSPASLSAAEEPSIAVVDVQALLTKSEAAKSIQSQTQKYREKFLADLTKQEEKLRATEKKLIEERKDMSQEDFIEKKSQFEKDFVESQKMAKSKKSDLDEAYTKAMAGLMDSVYEVVQSVADEKGYDLVLSKQNVIVGEQSMDISEECMKLLNKKTSKIKLDLKEG